MSQLEEILDNQERERSRLRRKRELTGPVEILKQKESFATIGSLEKMDDSIDEEEEKTDSESLADSSVYRLLHDDLETLSRAEAPLKSLKNYYYKDK